MMRVLLTSAMILLLAACAGDSGENVQSLPDPGAPAASRSLVLEGPAPRTDDVQQFRIHVWENVAGQNRCGQCHGAGGQQPTFARNDDINLAYDAANTIVSLTDPAQSRMAQKVAGGHNCWLASGPACGDILATWISAWAGQAASNNTAVVLTPPVSREPGATRAFPADSTAFATTVHPLLLGHCADCHTDSGVIRQSPFFGVADVDVAYAAARDKISLDTPANSRLVVRLRDEFHNCWTDCASDGAAMLAAINDFAAQVPDASVDPDLVASRALYLTDGIVASGGGRNDGNAIALYEFKTLTGTTAFDTSGVEPALDLSFTGEVGWVGGWGIRIGAGGKAQGTTSASAKLGELITATGELSVEAWVTPANVTQEEAVIVGYSGGPQARNFFLEQNLYRYDFGVRSAASDAVGAPTLATADADEVLQATLQHVVMTIGPTTGRRLYVNGELVAEDAVQQVADWDDTFALVVGNEVARNQTFNGLIRLLAIHNRVLDESQVRENYAAGVGEEFYLLFGISHLVDVPEAYIVFLVSQFDDYSYLFTEPRFLSLADGAIPEDIPLEGLQIGINGRLPSVGQAWQRLSLVLSADDYDPESGITLSEVGTILGIESAPDIDQFFLSFSRLGDHENVVVTLPQAVPAPVDQAPMPTLGIRQFAAINASLGAMTGVAMNEPSVGETYQLVRQQLPANSAIEGFLSSQQMAVTQLAIRYCDVLVDDPDLRASRFPGADFTAAPAIAFGGASRDALLDGLLLMMRGGELATQPESAAARTELATLVDELAAGGGDAARSRIIAKSACAAAIGNAAMLIY